MVEDGKPLALGAGLPRRTLFGAVLGAAVTLVTACSADDEKTQMGSPVRKRSWGCIHADCRWYFSHNGRFDRPNRNACGDKARLHALIRRNRRLCTSRNPRPCSQRRSDPQSSRLNRGALTTEATNPNIRSRASLPVDMIQTCSVGPRNLRRGPILCCSDLRRR